MAGITDGIQTFTGGDIIKVEVIDTDGFSVFIIRIGVMLDKNALVLGKEDIIRDVVGNDPLFLPGSQIEDPGEVSGTEKNFLGLIQNLQKQKIPLRQIVVCVAPNGGAAIP